MLPPRARRLGVLTLALAAAAAFAGPADAALLSHSAELDPVNDFPIEYTDDAGLSLEQCTDGTPLCLDGTPAAPEVLWWSAEAALNGAGGEQARLVMALELAAAPAPAANGGNIRIDGTNFDPNTAYTVTYPYGTARMATDADGRLVRFLDEVGCDIEPGQVCDPSLALDSHIGPFLRWDPAFGAAPDGYVGDPAVPHQVVGSPTGTNVFRIQGPNAGGPGVDVLETDLFTVAGKIRTNAATAFDDWGPRSLDFGHRVLGTGPATQSVTVRNTGFGPLGIDPPVLDGVDYALANGCPPALPPGGSCAVGVTFAPTGVGQRGATLTIRTSAPNGDRSTATGSTRVVPIIGAGSNPPPPPPTAGVAATRRPALSGLRPSTSLRRRTVLRRGLTLRVRIRNASRVLVRIRRGRRLIATRTVRVRNGRIRLADARLRRLLRPGTYTVALTPVTRAGVRGTTRVVRVRVRR